MSNIDRDEDRPRPVSHGAEWITEIHESQPRDPEAMAYPEGVEGAGLGEGVPT